MLHFLPNGSFPQPTFHANAMFANCSGTTELNVTAVEGGSTAAGKLLLDAGAGVVAGGDAVGESESESFVVRLVHFGTAPVNVTLELMGLRHRPLPAAATGTAGESIATSAEAARVTLAGGLDALNSPGVQLVAPVEDTVALAVRALGGRAVRVGPVAVAPTSVTILRFALAAMQPTKPKGGI